MVRAIGTWGYVVFWTWVFGLRVSGLGVLRARVQRLCMGASRDLQEHGCSSS